MKLNTAAIIFLLCSLGFFATAQTSNDNLIGAGFQKLHRTTTYKDLQNMFGKNNVKNEIDPGPEGGDSIRITKIYPGTPKEFVVYWADKFYHKRIGSVEFDQPHSPYFTSDSLTIGSTLKKLLAVNGKRISFSGLNWDYGGFISSFGKGRLKSSTIFFRLNGKDSLPEKLMGDIQLNTDMPLVKKNLDKMVVGQITLVLSK